MTKCDMKKIMFQEPSNTASSTPTGSPAGNVLLSAFRPARLLSLGQQQNSKATKGSHKQQSLSQAYRHSLVESGSDPSSALAARGATVTAQPGSTDRDGSKREDKGKPGKLSTPTT